MQEKISLKDFKDMKTRYEAFIEKNNREPQWVATPAGERVNLSTFKDMLDRYNLFKKQNGREPKVIYVKAQKQEDKVSLEAFKDMLRRYNAFKEKNGRDPAWVQTPDGSRVQIKDFLDMKRRYNEFMAREGREPKVIYVKAQKQEKKPADDGWVTTGSWKQDYQDTDHTCGPSSLQMALSALGCNATESELAKAAGTLSSGTSHDGMRKAVAYAAKKCKKNFSLQFKYFRDIGWDGVIKHIKAGGEVVIHVVTRPGLDTDVAGNIIWKRAYGHYVYLVGVNKAKGQVRIADPTKGVVTFPVKGVEQAMRNWPGESLLLISVKK